MKAAIEAERYGGLGRDSLLGHRRFRRVLREKRHIAVQADQIIRQT